MQENFDEDVSPKKRLAEKALQLPFSPGVYIIKDKNGKIIYIGKSKALRNRVSQYFGDSTGHNAKTEKMVRAAWDFDYIVCDSEMEALTLENQLIKLHSPHYNIRLKDDKSYPYIKVTSEDYPKIIMTRTRAGDKAKYYGPYSGTSHVFSVIRTLQHVFRLAHCNKNFPDDFGKGRPCLYYQMGQCMAPCTGQVSSEEYRAAFPLIHQILKGSFTEVKHKLTQEMLQASEHMQYEQAALIRDRIASLEVLWQKQKVAVSPDVDADVIALYSCDKCSSVSILYIRSGCIYDSRSILFSADEILNAEAFPSFLVSLYAHKSDIGKQIYLNVELSEDDRRLCEEYLCKQSEGRVRVIIPKRGDALALCNMAYENARQKAADYIKNAERDNQILIKLASMLRLEVIPDRIEAYDISNFGNDNITGGMITIENGKFQKSKYRIFNISEHSAQDDYGAMREVLSRRLAHLGAESDAISSAPDLILLDGGKNHVATVCQVMNERGIHIPVFGMVKDEHHKTRALCTAQDEISIAREQSVFMFIYRIQEEVHRFSITKMQRAKSKSVKTSSLTKIEGIGEKKAAELMRHFKTLTLLMEASAEDISKVRGFSEELAERTYRFLHP